MGQKNRSSSRSFGGIFIAVLVLGLLAITASYLAPVAIRSTLEGALRSVVPHLNHPSAVLSIRGAEARFPAEFRVKGISVFVMLPATSTLTREYQITADIRGIRARIPRPGLGTVQIRQMTIDMIPTARTDDAGDFEPQSYTVVLRNLQGSMPVNFLSPAQWKKSFVSLRTALEELWRSGRAAVDLTGQGRVLTRLEGVPIEVDLDIRSSDGMTVISLEREGVEELGALTEEGLTTAEIDLLLDHPTKAPRLLAIERRATLTARKAAAAQPGFPEDAYRHVLWSYLLTKAFGAEFALLATDAHETGSNRILETDADRAMDLNNNRIGVGYALDGVRASSLVQKVLTDPDVVRFRQDRIGAGKTGTV